MRRARVESKVKGLIDQPEQSSATGIRQSKRGRHLCVLGRNDGTGLLNRSTRFDLSSAAEEEPELARRFSQPEL